MYSYVSLWHVPHMGGSQADAQPEPVICAMIVGSLAPSNAALPCPSLTFTEDYEAGNN